MSDYSFWFYKETVAGPDGVLPLISDWIKQHEQLCHWILPDSTIPSDSVVIGNRKEHIPALKQARIAIGFGKIAPIEEETLLIVTHAAYSEEVLCQFLKQL